MTPDHEQLQQDAHDHLLLHFSRNGAFGPDKKELLVLDRGEGPYVFDTKGRQYLDGLSSLFCSQIGYSHGEEMAAAAASQLTSLPFNTNWGTAHPAAIKLATKLASLAPDGIEHAFFTSGGSESVETAWKLVRQYHLANGEPQRTKAIARHIAYHGVTLGALSFTGVPGYKEPFGTPPIDVTHVSNTNRFRRVGEGREFETDRDFTAFLLQEMEDAIQAAGPETVAMIIAEPLQNAGGCLTPPEGYWPGLREIADRHGILLVADEVITGMGRLGEFFGVTRFGGQPDLITIAKGLTSAYASMGAVMVGEKVASALHKPGVTLLHGITFGGHPVAASIALKNLEIFERDGVLENVRAHEGYLRERMETLRALPIVGDVRGAGYFWATELVKDGVEERFDADEREDLLRGFLPGKLLETGLIARGDDRGDSVLQVAPPLISDKAVIDELVAKLHEVLTAAGEHMNVAASAPTTTAGVA
ncbi:MAG TPA: aspartate aminotransferase family protein [Solirubrobacteraceae bacterium]|nr:aspartate aminotransferase family protein [Solirubrobacteraceae bacterium]